MTTFTPGPWKWEADESGWRLRALCDIERNGTCPNFDGNDPIVDDGSAGGEYSQTIDPTTSANAPLIAAAPELYQSLETLTNVLTLYGLHTMIPFSAVAEALLPAAQALAKARGETDAQ